MEAFNFGPFTFSPGRALRVAGTASRGWTMNYSHEEIAARTIPATATQDEIIEAFSEDRYAFVRRLPQKSSPSRNKSGAYVVDLVRSTEITGDSGEVLASFDAYAPIDGMSSGLIDDRFETWAVSAYGVIPMSRNEFDRLAAASAVTADAIAIADTLRAKMNTPMPFEWITQLLPASVLSADPEDWRPPTSWEIRHVVGEGSFTRESGAKAAKLVGVTPQNFRKYTARDDASTRQNMSFAMWHLLLHKLLIKRAETVI